MAFITQSMSPSGPVRARRFDHRDLERTFIHVDVVGDGHALGYISMNVDEARRLIADLAAVVADIDGDYGSGADDLPHTAFPNVVAGEC